MQIEGGRLPGNNPPKMEVREKPPVIISRKGGTIKPRKRS
jgi:hypothetical protein